MPLFNYTVISNQIGPHPDIFKLTQKHGSSIFKRPISTDQLAGFELANAWVREQNLPIILDSGCGTGMSTLLLAKRFPNHAVVGIDKSLARLKRVPACDEAPHTRVFFVQSNLEDIWRLILHAGWNISRHYLLYPNPWPKSEHVKRRWHGHPVFPALICLSPYLEVRSNWKIYLEEFSLALALLAKKEILPEPFLEEEPLSLFEKKYWQAECPTYRLVYQA